MSTLPVHHVTERARPDPTIAHSDFVFKDALCASVTGALVKAPQNFI
jgi:hypothetical protein